MENNHLLDADRIALRNMFKAIAEYGRKVRLRRQTECQKVELEESADIKLNSQVCPSRRKKKRTQRKK